MFNQSKRLLAFLFVFLIILTGCTPKTPVSTSSASSFSQIISDETTTTTTSFAPSGSELTVTFIDVGQGEAIYIRTPAGKHILIDSGTLSSKQTILQFLTDRSVTELEYFILTHPHADHIGAADEVIKAIPVKNVLMPDAATNTKVFERLLEALEERDQINVIPAERGQRYEVDSVTLDILSPDGKQYDNLNLYSIVLLLQYGEKRFLFTGDAEIENETAMLEAGYGIHADVLGIGHHGSRTSTSTAFLAAVSPNVAVISCGKDNTYGHPHQEILDRLQGITTFRTDQDGTITLKTDGITILKD